MSTHHLDTDKTLAWADVQRRSLHLTWAQVARQVRVAPSVFTRLRAGKTPSADALCSLVAWLDCNLVDLTAAGPRTSRRPDPGD